MKGDPVKVVDTLLISRRNDRQVTSFKDGNEQKRPVTFLAPRTCHACQFVRCMSPNALHLWHAVDTCHLALFWLQRVVSYDSIHWYVVHYITWHIVDCNSWYVGDCNCWYITNCILRCIVDCRHRGCLYWINESQLSLYDLDTLNTCTYRLIVDDRHFADVLTLSGTLNAKTLLTVIAANFNLHSALHSLLKLFKNAFNNAVKYVSK